MSPNAVELLMAVISLTGVITPAMLLSHDKRTHDVTPTYDSCVTQIKDLWARLDHQSSVIDGLTARVSLLERREALWQRGWDELRAEWGVVRQSQTPPSYPTQELLKEVEMVSTKEEDAA